MGTKLKLYGFASIQSPADVQEFLEGHTGLRSVVDVQVGQSDGSARAHAMVEFTTTEAAGYIKNLAANRFLWYQNSYLKAWDMNHVINDVMLNIGCQISEKKLYVLWCHNNVSVNFGSDTDPRKFNFFLTYNFVEYNLEVSLESIREIEFYCPQRPAPKFLVIRLLSAPRIYEKDGQWVRQVDFTPFLSIGQSSALCLKLRQRSHVPKIVRDFCHYKESIEEFILEKGSSFSYNSELVPTVNPPKHIPLPFKILFKINLLVQHGCIPGPSLDYQFFRLVNPTMIHIAYIEHALEMLFHLREPCYDPVKWLKLQYREYYRSRTIPKPPQIALDDGLVYVHKILVTPSKVYFRGPEPNLSNRVLRTYPNDIDNFLRISFVDEDGDRLSATALSGRTNENRHTGIYTRILSILRNGIEIGDKKFETLAFSNSQLQENSLWMFASRPGLSAASIREGLGDFSDIKNIAKFAARLGQSFGSSRMAVHVDSSEVEMIPDVEIQRDGRKYVFSEGIGKISSELAETAARKWGFQSYIPSAFQIRYAGYKGVVAVDPTSMVKLSLRKSMYKYKSSSTSLDVMAVSKYQLCFLNRQLIMLMSTLGVRDYVFERKQREAVAKLDAILVDPERALEAIEMMSFSKEYRNILKELLMCGYKPNEEPFISLMLQTLRASHLQQLRSKTRIFVPDGRAMMGTLDETASLEYGQVFVRYCGSKYHHSDEYNIVEGKVVVAKNPCLHPGDMRVLLAVNVPALHHMADCIVFPAKGKRPHTDECSGSDLDGDIYFVCWDPDLIPPHQVPPMDYTPAQPKVSKNGVTIEDVEEYFVDYMMNDSLGIICNAHVVFADKEWNKAMSHACVELAKLASIAVDFPKTGLAAEVPHYLRVKEFPDFMERQEKISYRSERVLGKLHRAVKDVMTPAAVIKSFSKEVSRRSYDPDMEVDGFGKYIEKAFYCKRQYDFKLGNLMDYYGIKTETEILSGSITQMARFFDTLKDNRGLSSAVESLKKEAKAWFNQTGSGSLDTEEIGLAVRSLRRQARAWFDQTEADSIYAKASAWYYVTYHHTYWGRYNEGLDRDHFLSFAWLVSDKLIHIKKSKHNTTNNLSSTSNIIIS